MKITTPSAVALAFAAGFGLSALNPKSTLITVGGEKDAQAEKANAPKAPSLQDPKWRVSRPTHVIVFSPNPVGAGNRSISVSPSLWEDQAKYYDLLGKEGKLLFAGPWREGGGALMVLSCRSDQEAQTIADEDPAVKSLMFVGQVRPWNVSYVGPWVIVPDHSLQSQKGSDSKGGGIR